jgi:hypothetical protein
MITNPGPIIGGGTGFLLDLGNESIIMTNRHVCEGVGQYGKVDVHFSKPVKRVTLEYRIFSLHDLCIITPPKDLKGGLKLALNTYPRQNAYIVGHPRLLPIQMAEGFIESEDIFGVMDHDGSITNITGVRIKVDSHPGNSGSPILNSDGEVIGVLFAGSPIHSVMVPLYMVKLFIRITGRQIL